MHFKRYVPAARGGLRPSRAISLRSTAVQRLAALAAAVLATACTSVPGPPPVIRPDMHFRYSLFTLYNTQTQTWAASGLEINRQMDQARSIWRGECQIEVDGSVREDIHTPLGNGKHPWEIYFLNSNNTLSDSARALALMKPAEAPRVHVFVVRRLWKFKSDMGTARELGGAVMPSSTGTPEPYVWLSGWIIRDHDFVLAHEFGHIMMGVNADRGKEEVTNLMREVAPVGTNLDSSQCDTARASSYSTTQ